MWWIEHRPETLEQMALAPKLRKQLAGYLEGGVIPNLLLLGPHGCGKTTLAGILIDRLSCDSLRLDASSDRGIDTIRGQVKEFAAGYPLPGSEWRVVFLDEMQGMTEEAMEALRTPMERYADHARFVLASDDPASVHPPIRSRCVEVDLTNPPLEERARVLGRVLDAEGVQPEPGALRAYASREADLRKTLTVAERTVSEGRLSPPAGFEDESDTLVETVQAVRSVVMGVEADTTASNRAVQRELPGELSEGAVSQRLYRAAEEGWIQNQDTRPGTSNAWTLTDHAREWLGRDS